MLNELKATLSIILVSCMISTQYECVEAALAVAQSKSNAGLRCCECASAGLSEQKQRGS